MFEAYSTSSKTVCVMRSVFESCITVSFSVNLTASFCGFAHELPRHDVWAERRERVVALAELPVRAVAPVGAAAAVGHVVHQRVAEDVLGRLVAR